MGLAAAATRAVAGRCHCGACLVKAHPPTGPPSSPSSSGSTSALACHALPAPAASTTDSGL